MTETPTPWPQALCACRDWMSLNLGRHVEGYHMQIATDLGGEIAGHLYYALSEQALFPYRLEDNVGVMYCEWVQQRYQKQGFGRLLYDNFQADMERAGVKGIVIEGTDRPGQMHIDHFLPRGFKVIQESGHRKLLYRPLGQEQIVAEMMQPHAQPGSGSSETGPSRTGPSKTGPSVEIVILRGYMCPFETATLLSLPGVAQEFGGRVRLRQVPLTRESLQEYGVTSGVFINGVQKLAGGESEEAIRQAIREELDNE
jgi:predicted GNAT family acetyltransferase